MNDEEVIVIGGGLAGSEAAWQLAQRGMKVYLYEMRPEKWTGAHQTDYLAELVCSNSLGTTILTKASGLLKAELEILGSLLIKIANETKVPAGSSLSVDRNLFASSVTEAISNHSNIEIIREELKTIPHGPTIISSGPLTSRVLSAAISGLTGEDNLFFFDALAPIISVGSIDSSKSFRSDRYQKEASREGDYINCPLSEEEYKDFLSALLSAKKIELQPFESEIAPKYNS